MKNVDIIQLSRNNIAITLNKHALTGMRSGGAQTIELIEGRRKLSIIILRDTEFQRRFQEFKEKYGMGELSRWQRFLNWFRPKQRISTR